MTKFPIILILLLATLNVVPMLTQSPKYPPLSKYMIPRDAEITLTKNTTPNYVSDHATIKIFTASKFQTMHEKNNDFVCVIMHGFTKTPTYTPIQIQKYINYDAKTRTPICLNPLTTRTVLPYYELQTKLKLEGKTAEQIAKSVQAAYTKNEIPKHPKMCFTYI